MKLEDIGFYTLSNKRAKNSSFNSPLYRCELLLIDKCNFNCPYCRGMRDDLKGTLLKYYVEYIIDLWANEGLKNIRFSGGEPTLYKPLFEIVKYAKFKKIDRIAISTNGSADLDYYKSLIDLGVNDFSISMDAYCSSLGKKMNGKSGSIWEKTIRNIEELSKLTYVTIGMVLNEINVEEVFKNIIFASNLGVNDIRIISSAQYNKAICNLQTLPDIILNKHPILKYRVTNFSKSKNVRGIKKEDSDKCALILDDMAIAKNYHFPCIIYLREMGDPIGEIGKNMRTERYKWYLNHNTHKDIICQKNCLDVCIDYNNTFKKFNERRKNG